MESVIPIPIPGMAEDYGDETFVEIDEMFFDPEFGRVIININDADAPDGFYQNCFNAWWHPDEDTQQIIVEDESAVGVPRLLDAIHLEHLTTIEILNECDNVRIMI